MFEKSEPAPVAAKSDLEARVKELEEIVERLRQVLIKQGYPV